MPDQVTSDEAGARRSRRAVRIRPTTRARGLAGAVVAAGLIFGACSSASHSTTTTTAGPGSTSRGTLSSGTSAGAAGTGPTINVGVVGSLTGAQASSCAQYGAVAPAWAKWINARGGITDHRVKAIIDDDQGQPSLALSQVETLIDSDHAVAIVVGCDNNVGVFDSFAIGRGVAVIGGPSNESDWLTKAGMFPTATGLAAGVADQVAVATKFGHATKIANAYCAEVAACQQANPLLASAAKAAGVAFTSVPVSSTAPTYTSQCVQLQQEKIDYLIMSFTSAAAVRFVQSCQAQGYNPTYGTTEQAFSPVMYSLRNFTAYGPAYAFPSVANAPPVATFRSAMEKYASSSNWREGTGSFTWDGLQVLDAALKNAGPSPTAASVRTALYGLKGSTLGGELANPIPWVAGQPLGLNAQPCYFEMELKDGQLMAPSGLASLCPAAS
jgi:branched-chain amino acid transport system substrate-binding protein